MTDEIAFTMSLKDLVTSFHLKSRIKEGCSISSGQEATKTIDQITHTKT
jgi:hypothetical protein